MTLKDRAESVFEHFGHFVCRWRWPVLLVALALATGLSSFLPQMKSDNSTDGLLRKDDPALQLYTEFRHQFGHDDYVMIAIDPPEVFDLAFLAKLRDLHHALEEEVPHVAEVMSLVNARQTRGEGDALIVDELMQEWPETAADVAALRERVFANPLYIDQFISLDGDVATVIVRPQTYTGGQGGSDDVFDGFEDEAVTTADFLTLDEKGELSLVLEAVVARFDAEDFRLYVAGDLVVGSQINRMIFSDARKFIIAGVLVCMSLVVILFRRTSALFFLGIMIAATVGSTFGIMVLMGIPFSMGTQPMPLLVMCVSVCNVVHVLVLFYKRWDQGASKEEAVVRVLRNAGLAILMTSLTTAAGMGSFLAADIAPIANVGIIAPIGVALAFLFSMTLLPALICIVPMRRVQTSKMVVGGDWLTRRLVAVGDFATSRPWVVLVVSAIFLVVSVVGISRIGFSHLPVSWFPDDHPIQAASAVINEKLHGAQTIEVIVDTGQINGLHDPDTLQRLELAMRYAESIEDEALYVAKTTSIVDVVKETHQALNGNDSGHYSIPNERELVAQELLLFESSGSDDLELLTDSQLQLARITLRIPMVDATQYPAFLERLRLGFADIFGPELSFSFTGTAPLFGRVLTAMTTSMGKSYLIALLVITPLMILLLGDWRIGLISMVPNLFPIIATLGVMGWLGMSLDATNIVVGSVLIGLAVDDTIHFLHRFQRHYAAIPDAREAVHKTMKTTGSALLFTTLVLGGGFLCLATLSSLKNTAVFGGLTVMGLALAFLADVIISPALMVLAMRPRKVKETEAVPLPSGAMAEPSQ